MWENFTAIFLINFFAMLSPGPDFFIIFKNAINYPLRVALWTVPGILVGLVVHISYNLFGLGLVLKNSPRLFFFLQSIGGLYLMYIGIKTLTGKSLKRFDRRKKIKIESPDAKQAFKEGLITNLFNVKAGLFFFSSFSLVLTNQTTLTHKAIYFALAITPSMIYWPGLILIIKKTPLEQWLLKYQRPINIALGTLLFGFGLKVGLFWI